MPNIQFKIKAPSNRRNMGTFEVVDSTGMVVLGPFNTYLLADQKTATKKNNAARDPLLPYGDTPTGTYDIVEFVPYSAERDNLGPNGSLRLKPTGGEALQAKNNGRTGLLIHGGRLGNNNKLRPTNGCLRLSDADMKKLVNYYNSLAAPQSCSIFKFTMDIETNLGDILPDGIDDGDPPKEIPPDTIVLP